MSKISILLLTIFLSACGQKGRLYLSDNERLSTSKNTIEIKQLNLRIAKKQKLVDEVKKLRNQEKNLIKEGKNPEKVQLERLEIEYEIGQIILNQQQEGRAE